MELTEYRNSQAEKARTSDLLRLIPASAWHGLDVGARDGFFSLLLADRMSNVTALDLTLPRIAHPRVKCLQGNAALLPFADRSFDFLFCAEVLEHIPEPYLTQACSELQRVASKEILIGVPNEQDIRVSRTTCGKCGIPNPPWGHVNVFDLARLKRLFQDCDVKEVSLVGERTEATNAVSTALMDFAGNPYGTYDQDELCIYCDKEIGPPQHRNIVQLGATKLSFWLRQVTEMRVRKRGNWIHVLFKKHDA